jgi:hypothetical protein
MDLPKTEILIATIIRILESEKKNWLAELLRESRVEIEQVDYDGRDGGRATHKYSRAG